MREMKRTRTVVTGPHRSGTTIAGKILAKELGLTYVDEKEIGYESLRRLLKVEEGIIQCPGLFKRIQEIPFQKVVMRRDLEDIERSRKRTGWRRKEDYVEWDRVKERVEDWYELEYESMSWHEMWVPKELRKRFKSKQTEPWSKLWE